MERSSEHDDIAVALAEARPTPRHDFSAELDELVAAGFPRDTRTRRAPLAAIAHRLRVLSPQRFLFATGGTALVAIVVATAIVASLDSGPEPAGVEPQAAKPQPQIQFSEPIPDVATPSKESSAASAQGSASETQASDEVQSSDSLLRFGRDVRHRDIERSAEISLLAEPADVADDSAQVFDTVHDARGIVLNSTTTAGQNAGARFELLIPSHNLGDALAAFSAIDEFCSRHAATTDIIAPTVSVEEQLRDSRAKIDGLLAQLSAAETESAGETVEIELRRERRHGAALQAQLERLQRRADYSRVSLRIEANDAATSSAGGWGIDDAVGDAGHILAVAAAVSIVGLAIVGPLVLIGLLAWLAHRLWLRRARDRALA